MSSSLAARISELKHLADRISRAADLILRNCASTTHTDEKFITLLDVASLNAGASAFALESLHLDFLSERIRGRSPLTAVAELVQSVHPRTTHSHASSRTSSFLPQGSARIFTMSPEPISPPPIYRAIPSFVLPPLGTRFSQEDFTDSYSEFDNEYYHERVSGSTAVTRWTREEASSDYIGRTTRTAEEDEDEVPDRGTSCDSKSEEDSKEPPEAGSTSPLPNLHPNFPVSIHELVDDDSKPDTRGGVKRKREPDLESTAGPGSSKKPKK